MSWADQPINSGARGGQRGRSMTAAPSNPLVHLELHTADLPRACALYSWLCGWRPQRVDGGRGSYLALELGGLLGAEVLLEPREGPAGWRSVVATPAGGEIAFWQPKL